MLVTPPIEQAQFIAGLHPSHLGMARRTFGQGKCIVLDQGAIEVQADGHDRTNSCHACLGDTIPIGP